MSERSLTGYDVRDAASGKPDEEVYLYDAASSQVTCASCNPSGARPRGMEIGDRSRFISDREWGPTTWLAANIPGWSGFTLLQSAYQPRYLSDSGRLFFNSSDALAPQDVNATEDVYEYEPAGIGDCATSSISFHTQPDGCVNMITSGTSPAESAFLDASESGGDVFFLTAAKLSSEDLDAGTDVYDARECTPAAPCSTGLVAPPPCSTGDSCKAAPTPQPTAFGAPASATFAGAGNVLTQAPQTSSRPAQRSLTRAQKLARALKTCRREKRSRKRIACERMARKRYGKTAAVKADGSKRRHGSSSDETAR
ncbi:MAG TPA: hypothetical protein VK781_06785 [Solirubrobacteraceae bacterium]|nr:hypothetical protein [Solirubrobacteraceae bacterium]